MTVPAVPQEHTLSEIGLPSDTDRAWAAGFFDGEGWTGVTKNDCTLRVSMAQGKDSESLERFARIVGAGRITGPYPGKKPGWSEQTRFTAHNQDAIRILLLIWPYLGTVKKQQALTAFCGWRNGKRRHAQAAALKREERMRATRERTHCIRGHALTEDNIYFHKRDQCPYCRTCQRERSRRSYYRRKEVKV